MSAADFSLMDLFREEVRAHVAALNEGLLSLEATPGDTSHLESLMRAAHSIKGAARIIGLDLAVLLAHALEDVFVAAQEGTQRLFSTDIDLCLRCNDILAELANLQGTDATPWSSKHETAIHERTDELRAILTRALGEAPPVKKPPPPSPPAVTIESTSLPPTVVEDEEIALELPQAETTVAEDRVVRVTARNLNRLMGLAGESLVQARWLPAFTTSLLKLKKRQDHLAALIENLAQSTNRQTDQEDLLIADLRRQSTRCRQALMDRIAEFEDHAARAEDLNARLYLEVIGSRMRPFADGVQGFPRMVRDLSRSLNKRVRLEIVGSTTEVDRDILEKMEAPLTHLLRNAVDHGIESAEERQAAGKPESALIRLEARHRAGLLIITVEDDGKGVDLDRLREKIVSRGHSSAEMVASMSEAELLSFLFLPGFSTAASVTETSGRGVGLDVVHDIARRVGGSVQVVSRKGRGTAFHLQLPITLSVLRAVLVDIGGEPFAFPHHRIDRLLRVPRAGLDSLENRQFLRVDEQNVGLVLAAQLFDLPPSVPEGEELSVLLVSDATGTYGLIVDAFRGEQDLVVRPLDRRLGKVPNVSALAIMDNGDPVLIADVEDLIRSMDRLIQTGTLTRCEPEKNGRGRKKRILVVEDSLTVREVERQILRNGGFDVTVAVDGQEGWNFARSEPFDLILTDVDMPRMNGLDLVRAVRADSALQDVPVIVVSYKDREEDRMRGLEVGANHYLTKSSFHDNTFLQAVKDLIGEP